MKIKWKELYKDMKNVLLKHFRPEVGPEPVEVQLLKSISRIQAQQKSLNDIREGFAPLAKQLGDGEILRELDRLAKMAPTEAESCDPVVRSDAKEDLMFG
jgi:hypothetical protein